MVDEVREPAVCRSAARLRADSALKVVFHGKKNTKQSSRFDGGDVMAVGRGLVVGEAWSGSVMFPEEWKMSIVVVILPLEQGMRKQERCRVDLPY